MVKLQFVPDKQQETSSPLTDTWRDFKPLLKWFHKSLNTPLNIGLKKKLSQSKLENVQIYFVVAEQFHPYG